MAITNLENSLPKVSSLHKMGFLFHVDFEPQTMLFVTRKRLSSRDIKTQEVLVHLRMPLSISND